MSALKPNSGHKQCNSHALPNTLLGFFRYISAVYKEKKTRENCYVVKLIHTFLYYTCKS